MIPQILTLNRRNDVDYDIVEAYGNMFLYFWKYQNNEVNNELNHKSNNL